MKKLIVLLVSCLIFSAIYIGCVEEMHKETAVTPEEEAAPETATPGGEAPVELTLKIQSITGTGSVNVDYGVTPVEVCAAAPCTYTIAKGTSVTLTGIGTGGQVFYKWTGSISDYESPKTFTMEENMTIDAKFVTPIEIRDLGKPDIDKLRRPLDEPEGSRIDLTPPPPPRPSPDDWHR